MPKVYDTNGFDQNGFDREGYDVDGYDSEGYDRNGFSQYSDDDLETDGDDDVADCEDLNGDLIIDVDLNDDLH